MPEEVKKLYRSTDEKILGGVCGGIGNYFGIDPVLVRIGWVVLTFVYGMGLLAYIIAWIIIPQEPERKTVAAPKKPAKKKPKKK